MPALLRVDDAARKRQPGLSLLWVRTAAAEALSEVQFQVHRKVWNRNGKGGRTGA